MKAKEKLNALKEEDETLNEKSMILSDEELEKVTGGGGFTLTDEMINQGGYLVGQADTITYNEEVYYNQHQHTTIDRVDMFIYKSGSGATLLIPYLNYS